MSPSDLGTPPLGPLEAYVEAPRPEGSGGGVGGLRCRVCGLDVVPWPRTAYCSERCRRRAAYLARKHRRRGAAGRPNESQSPKGTRP